MKKITSVKNIEVGTTLTLKEIGDLPYQAQGTVTKIDGEEITVNIEEENRTARFVYEDEYSCWVRNGSLPYDLYI